MREVRCILALNVQCACPLVGTYGWVGFRFSQIVRLDIQKKENDHVQEEHPGTSGRRPLQASGRSMGTGNARQNLSMWLCLVPPPNRCVSQFLEGNCFLDNIPLSTCNLAAYKSLPWNIYGEVTLVCHSHTQYYYPASEMSISQRLRFLNKKLQIPLYVLCFTLVGI